MSIAIKIENLSKQYRLGLVSTRTLSHDLNRWWQTSILGREDPYLKIGDQNILSTRRTPHAARRSSEEYVWALKDINLEIEEGEILGIIGKNGAGKSTLLKILSKVTSPTTGIIKARGRIASLLEVGTGFHQEMTGRENIYMNGAIMGMTKREITSKLDEIVSFAGVERYLDTPVKRYSSGMTVRLGFAVAAHLDPEILVVDEVLAVGDADFQKKAIGKMQDISKGDGRTVLFVSHNMGSMQTLCRSGILLENGRVSFSGSMGEVIDKYLSNQKVNEFYLNEASKNEAIYVKSISLTDTSNNEKNFFLHTEKIRIHAKIEINNLIPETYLLITVLDKFKRKVFSAEKLIGKAFWFILEIQSHFLTRGIYSIQVTVYKPATAKFDFIEDVCSFEIVDAGSQFAHLENFNYGCVFGNYIWY